MEKAGQSMTWIGFWGEAHYLLGSCMGDEEVVKAHMESTGRIMRQRHSTLDLPKQQEYEEPNL